MKKLSIKNFNLKNYIVYIVIAALILIFGLLKILQVNDRKYAVLLVSVCINIILAVSLSLVVGYLGELSLGHAGFMAVGAYAGCLVSIHLQGTMPEFIVFFLALLIGGMAAALFGFIIGIPVLRLKGDYLAIVTLAFGEIIRSLVQNFEFTGGAMGLDNIPKSTDYITALVIIMILIIVIQNLIKSRHGRAIMAIRDNDIAARSVGINVTYYKLTVFIISAFFAGIAGVLYGHYYCILTPSDFSYNKSIDILVFVVMGGMGNITGAMISATVLTLLPEWLRFLSGDWRMLIYAIALIALMIFNNSPVFKTFREKYNIKSFIPWLKKKFSKKTAAVLTENAPAPEIQAESSAVTETDTGNGTSEKNTDGKEDN